KRATARLSRRVAHDRGLQRPSPLSPALQRLAASATMAGGGEGVGGRGDRRGLGPPPPTAPPPIKDSDERRVLAGGGEGRKTFAPPEDIRRTVVQRSQRKETQRNHWERSSRQLFLSVILLCVLGDSVVRYECIHFVAPLPIYFSS